MENITKFPYGFFSYGNFRHIFLGKSNLGKIHKKFWEKFPYGKLSQKKSENLKISLQNNSKNSFQEYIYYYLKINNKNNTHHD